MSPPGGHESTGRSRYRAHTAASESARKSRGDTPPVQYGNGLPYAAMAPMPAHYGAPYDPSYAYPPPYGIPGPPGPPSQMSGDSHGQYSHGRPAYVDAKHPNLPRGPYSSQDPSLTSDSGSYSSEHPSSPGYDRGPYGPPTPLSPYGAYPGYPPMPMSAHSLGPPPPDLYGMHHPMPPPPRKGHKKNHSYAAPGAPGYYGGPEYGAPGPDPSMGHYTDYKKEMPQEQWEEQSDNDDIDSYPIDSAPPAPTAPNSTVRSRGHWQANDIPSARPRTAFGGSGGYQPPPADDASRRGRETYGGPEELGRGRRSVPPTASHGGYAPPKPAQEAPPCAETPPSSSHEEFSPRASRRGARSQSRVRQSNRRPRSKSRLRNRTIRDSETTDGPVQPSVETSQNFDLQKPPRRRAPSRMRYEGDASSARHSSPDRRTYGSSMPAAPDPFSPDPSSSSYDDYPPAHAPAPQAALPPAAAAPPTPAPAPTAATYERPPLSQAASYPPPAGGSAPAERPALPHIHTYHGASGHYPGVTYTAPSAPPAETAVAPAHPMSILRNRDPEPVTPSGGTSMNPLSFLPPPGSIEPEYYIRPADTEEERYTSQPLTYRQELAPAHDFDMRGPPRRNDSYRGPRDRDRDRDRDYRDRDRDRDYRDRDRDYYDDGGRSRYRREQSRPRGKSRLREKSTTRHRSPSRKRADDYGVEYGRGPRPGGSRRDGDRRRRDGEQAQKEANERAKAESDETDRKLAELLAEATRLSNDKDAIDIVKEHGLEIPSELLGK